MPRLYTNVAGSGIDVRVRITSNNTTWLNGTPLLNNSPGQGNELSFQVDFANISNNPKVTNLFEFFVTGTGRPPGLRWPSQASRQGTSTWEAYRDVVTVTGVDAVAPPSILISSASTWPRPTGRWARAAEPAPAARMPTPSTPPGLA